MKNRKESVIIFLIACIVFTPILACMGINGIGGLIIFWGGFLLLWWFLFGKDMWEIDKYKKEGEERQKEYKKQEEIWETEKEKRDKDFEIQRKTAGLITDASFKTYMKRMGFSVDGTIKVPRQTFSQYYHNIKPTAEQSTIIIITHKSMNQLRVMGINNIRQLLGDYHKYFYYRMDNVNGGFYENIVKGYDSGFKEIEKTDSNNMCATITYYPELDNNNSIRWDEDDIYLIKKEVASIKITPQEKNTFFKWSEENEIRDYGTFYAVTYNKYTVYRDNKVVVRDGNSRLTEKERDFIIKGVNQKEKFNAHGIFRSHESNGVIEMCGKDASYYYQIDVFNLLNL